MAAFVDHFASLSAKHALALSHPTLFASTNLNPSAISIEDDQAGFLKVNKKKQQQMN